MPVDISVDITEGFSASRAPMGAGGVVEVRREGVPARNQHMLSLYRACLEAAGFTVADGKRGRPFLRITAGG